MSVGLTLTRQPPVSPAASAGADQPAGGLWHALATDGLAEYIEDRVCEVVGDVRAGRRGLVLEHHGVTALDGLFASAVAGLADADPIHEERQEQARRLIAEFGAAERSVVGMHAPLDEVADGPLAVLDACDNTPTPTPTVAVRLDGFEELRADQREDVVGLFADLAATCDLRIVASGFVQAKLRREFHQSLPGVNRPCNAHPSDGEVAARVESARDALGHDSKPVAILRALADESSETLTYNALAGVMSVGRGTIRNHVTQRLVTHDLVDRFDHLGTAHVSLTHVGRQFIETLETEIGVQRTISDSVKETGQSVSDSRVTPPAREGSAPTNGGGAGRHRLARHHQVRGLARWHYAGTAAVARDGGVALADRGWSEADDRGEPGFYYDDADDRVVVSAEYDSPFQWWVCIARALTSPWMFRHVLPPEAFDGEDADSRLAELFSEFRWVLRDSRCVGYLEDAASGEEFVGELQNAEEHLCELTRRWKHREFDCSPEEYRSIVTREAIGLASTVVHLLDLAGVDVVREARVPTYRQFDKGDRRTVARSVAKGAAIQSRYAEFAGYRQLFEDREKKRESTIRPTVDADDPVGEVIGSVVVTGPGVGSEDDDLAGLIADEVDNRERHEDAPDFSIRVPVDSVAGDRRTATAQAVRQACSAKGLSPTRRAVSWFDAFAATPHDAARACYQLGDETKVPGRDIEHHDVRYALSTLDSDRLLPDMKPTIGAMFKTILTTDPDTTLSNTDIEARGGPSTRSIRRHADALEAFGLLERTDAGWRLPGRLPVETTDGHALARDLVAEAVHDLLDERRYTDPTDPVGGALFAGPGEMLPALREAWPWLDPWIRAVCDLRDESAEPETPAVARFGDPPTQASIATGRAAG